jgi:type IV pilus assembly protein PilE
MTRNPRPDTGKVVRAHARGVTLVELLVVLTVLAIITGVAFPTFTQAMRKSRRADAMAALTAVMQAQERYRANNASYYQGSGGVSTLPGAPSNSLSANGYYSLEIASGSASSTGYTAVATVVSATSQAADTTCGALKVTISGGNAPAYSSTNSSGTANNPDTCWVH